MRTEQREFGTRPRRRPARRPSRRMNPGPWVLGITFGLIGAFVLTRLLALQREIATRKTARWIGRDVTVLVESRDELGRPFGRIRQGKRAVVLGNAEPGTLVDIRVVQATAGQLIGARAA